MRMSSKRFLKYSWLVGLISLVAVGQPLSTAVSHGLARPARQATASVGSIIRPELPRDWRPQRPVKAADIERGMAAIQAMRERLAGQVKVGKGTGALVTVAGGPSKEVAAQQAGR